MASKVLRDLDELRQALAQPTSACLAAAAAAAGPGSPARLAGSAAAHALPTAGSAPPHAHGSSCWAPGVLQPGGRAGAAGAGVGGGSSSSSSPIKHGLFGSHQGRQAAAAFSISSSGTTTSERLGRALEAAEEEMDAALARQADIMATQLRAREADIAEAQRAAVAAEGEARRLRAELAAAKQAAAAAEAALEARLAAKDAELSGAQAELLALHAQVDDLNARLAHGQAALGRADAALCSHTNELSRRLAGAAADAEAAAAAAGRERSEKELLLAELAATQADLAAARDELSAAAVQLERADAQAAADAESRQQLQAALERAAAAAASLKEAKDLEAAELRRRLRAERDVRKACVAWLTSELRNREEMGCLLVAVRDMAAGAAAGGAVLASGDGNSSPEVAGVEALLARLNKTGAAAAALGLPSQQQQQQRQHQVTHVPPEHAQQQLPHAGPGAPAAAAATGPAGALEGAADSISRLLTGEVAASKAREEFVQMKVALGEDSRRLKQELRAARMAARRGGNRSTHAA